MTGAVEGAAGVAVLAAEVDSLVAGGVAAFARAVDALARQGRHVVIDLSGAEFIDSAGCAALLRSRRRLLEGGGRLAVCCPSPPVRALFDVAGIGRALDVYPSRERAAAMVGGTGRVPRAPCLTSSARSCGRFGHTIRFRSPTEVEGR
jgi:anti-sigma B factor antagonist